MHQQERAVEHLCDLIRIRSFSSPDMQKIDFAPFDEIRGYLKNAYPQIHQTAEITVINGGALLYHFPSQNRKSLPLLFMAHMDVVPVAEETLPEWRFDPFGGVVEHGMIYGRGAKDMKNQLVAFFEATEQYLEEGNVLPYDLYFVLGFDEENGGKNGTAQVAAYLKEQGVQLGMVLDEGGVITDGILGLKEEIALIGVCEKGYLSVKITAKDDGGHASMPPVHSALGMICKAGVRLEAHQMPQTLTEPLKEMLRRLAPHTEGATRKVLSKPELYGPLLKKILAKTPDSNALSRTTTALTQAQGAAADNILPNQASLVVNFRVLPSETVEDVLLHVQKVIGKGYEIEPMLVRNPSRISAQDEYFEMVGKAAKTAYPSLSEAVPFIMVGGTDSIYFDGLCSHIYKFGPFRCNAQERTTIHGINEFLRIEDLMIGIRFFTAILHAYH